MSTNARKAGLEARAGNGSPKISPLDALRVATGEANAHRAVEINLDSILVDESIQVRVEGLNEETVASYVAVLENGGELDPITVFRCDVGGYEYMVADGYHRIEAHIRLARLKIWVYVREGDYEAALEEAEEGNMHHGRPLSSKDKKNILWRRLERKHQWSTLSYREIGKLLGVSHVTIKSWIEEFSTVKNLTVDRSTITGADGRQINTSNIGKSQTQAQEKPSPSPSPYDGAGDEDVPFDMSPSQQVLDYIAAANEPAMESFTLSQAEKERIGRANEIAEAQLPMGVRFGRIDTGEASGVPVPQDDATAVAFRVGNIGAALTNLHAVMRQFEANQSVRILEKATVNDRDVVASWMKKIILHALGLWHQVLQIEPAMIEYQADWLNEVDGKLGEILEWSQAPNGNAETE